jgi:hypothetical protein
LKISAKNYIFLDFQPNKNIIPALFQLSISQLIWLQNQNLRKLKEVQSFSKWLALLALAITTLPEEIQNKNFITLETSLFKRHCY